MQECYNIENQMRDFRRCGCHRCREQAYILERDYVTFHRNLYKFPMGMSSYKFPSGEMIGIDMAKEIKVEQEPKNYAVKLLVDKLKVEQSNLSVKKTAIEGYKTRFKETMKIFNGEKFAIENKIKELSLALKKLGHKETV